MVVVYNKANTSVAAGIVVVWYIAWPFAVTGSEQG